MSSNLANLFNNAKKVKLVHVQENKEPENETIPEDVTTPRKKIKTVKEEHDHEDSSMANTRTIFVGNVPVGCKQKELKLLFSQYGTIESVRLRNIIPLHPKRGKRLAFIKKEYHPMQKSITAFIRFSNDDEANNATSLNGHVYKEHHLRVDMAEEKSENIKHDNKRSIFIGNLPFDVNDDDIWKVFEECGEIENVRLVRDRATSIGKGFGYVLFRDEASVGLALRMNGNCQVQNRQIRIKTAAKKPKLVKPIKHIREKTKRTMKQKKSLEPKNGEGVKQGRIEKRPAVKKRKELQNKKKKNISTKTNNLQKDVIQLKKKP